MQASYPRIAFLLASLHTGAAHGLWPELISAAQSHRCVLYVLPGGRLNAKPGFEHMRNGVYRLARSSNVDSALCWASTLSGYATESAVERFLLETVDVPLVTFGLKIGQHPFVGVDAYTGMKALVKHFIRTHKKRRIAFIAGPRQHSSAEERYRAYCDALKEAHIAYDPSIVCLDIPWTEGRRAVIQLLDERKLKAGKDFDALCAASDLLAFDAAMVLREQGIRIPLELAVGGFNDSEESRIFSPPLTTVHMPFSNQALRAFHLLLDMRSGAHPDDISLKTKLVIRGSCGCVMTSIQKASRISVHDVLPPGLVEAFEASLNNKRDHSFISYFERMLDAQIGTMQSLEDLHDVLSSLRLRFLGEVDSRDASDRAERLIHQGRVIVSLVQSRKYELRLWNEKQDEQKLNLLNQELLCAKDLKSVVKAAAAHLPHLGISSGYMIIKNKNGVLSFCGGFEQKKGFSSVEILRPASYPEVVRDSEVLPERLVPNEPGAYFVLPLFFESTDLGHLVLQGADIDPSLYEEIRSVFSSALRGVMLFEQADEARKRAERAEKSKSDIVAVVSRELQRSVEAFDSAQQPDARAVETFRLKELTSYLVDLSEAQSDTMLSRAKLFDPYALCADWADRQSMESGSASGGGSALNFGELNPSGLQVKLGEAPLCYPAIYGDAAQLERVLSILANFISEAQNQSEVKLSVAPSRRGISFLLSAQGKRAMEIRSIKDIRLELAERIALLHGGEVRLSSNQQGAEAELCLPYPTISGTINSIPDDSVPLMFIASTSKIPESELQFFESKDDQVLPYVAVFNMKISDERRPLLFLDPEAVTPDGAPALAFMLDQEPYRRIECFIALRPGSGLFAEKKVRFSDAGEFLRSTLQGYSESAIIVLGKETAQRPVFAGIQRIAQAAGFNCIPCDSSVAVEAVVSRWQPALILALETGFEQKSLALVLQRFSHVPLIVASRNFEGPEGLPVALLERPRTVFCNTGEAFAGLLDDLVCRILVGKKFLASSTAAIVAKSILFLNKWHAGPLSRWKLASSLNTSEDYLSRIFHMQMGISLWGYLARLRVVHAIRLLQSTGASLAEIADRTGFKDEAYFCRVFRKIIAATPGSFRSKSFANVRKVQEPD